MDTLVITTDSRASINDFLSKHPVDAAMLFDDNMAVAQAYQVTATPTGFLANRQGVLKYTSVGWSNDKMSELQAEVDKALSE